MLRPGGQFQTLQAEFASLACAIEIQRFSLSPVILKRPWLRPHPDNAWIEDAAYMPRFTYLHPIHAV